MGRGLTDIVETANRTFPASVWSEFIRASCDGVQPQANHAINFLWESPSTFTIRATPYDLRIVAPPEKNE